MSEAETLSPQGKFHGTKGSTVKIRKGILTISVAIVLASVSPAILFAGGSQEGSSGKKAQVTFFMNLYEGLTNQYITDLQKAFNAANPSINLQLVPVDWSQSLTKLTTAIAGGSPPGGSVIGTYWLVRLYKLNAVAQIDKYVSQKVITDISPGALQASTIGGKLMGLPEAAGSRIMAVNASIDPVVPKTMEQLEQQAIHSNDPPNHFGLIMAGKNNGAELTPFLYYLYADGGNVFAKNPDGTWGKCIVNNAVGVKILTFMVKLANQDKVVEPSFLSLTREQSQPLFAAGKAAYALSGAWMPAMYKAAKSNFKIEYRQIPPFQGVDGKTLIVTDSVAIFKAGKNLKDVGKFLDFWYTKKYRAPYDKLIGFPPIMKSLSNLPAFQTPLYKAMAIANGRAKGYPLVDHWNQIQTIIWDASIQALNGSETPKQALDAAAAQINQIRGT